MPSHQGNIIITKTEAGTIKYFHFNLEVQDQEFNINPVSFNSIAPCSKWWC